MMRVRMATVDESARNELLVIYMEALSWSGTALGLGLRQSAAREPKLAYPSRILTYLGFCDSSAAPSPGRL